MNKTMCFSFVFQEVLRVWLRKKHHVCHNVGMYLQRRNVVSPHDPGFFCTKMTINSKIKWNQIKVGAIAISYRCCRSPALWKQVQHISTFFPWCTKHMCAISNQSWMDCLVPVAQDDLPIAWFGASLNNSGGLKILLSPSWGLFVCGFYLFFGPLTLKSARPNWNHAAPAEQIKTKSSIPGQKLATLHCLPWS